ncbi:MAG: thioredoxin family protein [Erysipelotrichaceae bacterium]
MIKHMMNDYELKKVIVFGGNCKCSKAFLDNVKEALIELNIKEEVMFISDNIVIAKSGVMSLPALIINAKVVSSGKRLNVKEIKELLKNEEI